MLNYVKCVYMYVTTCTCRFVHGQKAACRNIFVMNFLILIFDFLYSVIHKQASIEFTSKICDFKHVLSQACNTVVAQFSYM